MRKAEREQNEAIEQLRPLLPAGSTVYTVLRHVSRSGMYRAIDCYVMQDGEPRWISSLVARAIGERFDKRHKAIGVSGCGMDMGFSIVHNLSYRLFPEGFGCIGEGNERGQRCPSSDHSNGDRDYTPHMDAAERTRLQHGEPGKPCGCHAHHWHKSGDYALRHRWM